MGSPVKLYQEEMHDNLGFFATWLPGDTIEIGDIGVLEGGRFRRMASAKDFGMNLHVTPGSAAQDVQYTSSKGTKIGTGVNADVANVANAAIKIDFSRAGAFVFHAAQLRLHRLENRAEVGQQIVQAYRDNKWNKDWLMIEALHTADAATIIVSEDSSAGIVLGARAAAIPSLMLADPQLDLSVSAVEGKIVHILGAKNLRPLYSCIRLRDSLFGGLSVKAVRGMSSQPADFERASLNELLES